MWSGLRGGGVGGEHGGVEDGSAGVEGGSAGGAGAAAKTDGEGRRGFEGVRVAGEVCWAT